MTWKQERKSKDSYRKQCHLLAIRDAIDEFVLLITDVRSRTDTQDTYTHTLYLTVYIYKFNDYF